MHFRRFRNRFDFGTSQLVLIVAAFMATAAGQESPPAASVSVGENANTGKARDRLSPERLRKHVYTLASDEFGGRRGEAAARTIDHIERHFEKAGLKPAFAQSFRQPVVQASSGKEIGTNLAATIEGTDPVLKNEWIILSAHWDHLGRQAAETGKVRTFAGADDNASGVAMLLETAAWFARPENQPKRSVMFVAFDLEEFGLFGSRHFAANSPIDLSSVRLFITADMIGRSLSGMCREWVFVIGSERLPQSREWISAGAANRSIRAGLLGTDLVGVRSDYGPFMTKEIPYLFFSTGESDVYHTTNDRPETIDYVKLHQIAELIRETTQQAANTAKIERWSERPVSAPEELTVIAAVLAEMKSPENGLKLGGLQKSTIDRTLEKIAAILDKGGMIDESERRAIVRAAQFLMFTAL
jgi:hypothetical protein